MQRAKGLQVLAFVFIFAAGSVVSLPAQAQTGISFRSSSATEELIQKALSQPIYFPAGEERLSKFAARLGDQLGFNVVLDTKALEGAGVGTDTLMRFPFRKARLASGLEFVLRDLSLTWVIRSESLIITTYEEAENTLETRVYPVSDLVTFQEKGRVVEDFEPLVDVLKSTTGIPKPGWVDDGGVGTVLGFPGGRLVCSQTSTVHVEVEGLLAALRLAAKMQGNTRSIYERYRPTFGEDNPFADSPPRRGRVARQTRRMYSINEPPEWLTSKPDTGD